MNLFRLLRELPPDPLPPARTIPLPLRRERPEQEAGIREHRLFSHQLHPLPGEGAAQGQDPGRPKIAPRPLEHEAGAEDRPPPPLRDAFHQGPHRDQIGRGQGRPLQHLPMDLPPDPGREHVTEVLPLCATIPEGFHGDLGSRG